MYSHRLAPIFVLLLATTSFAAVPDAPWFPKAPPLPAPTGQVIHVKSVEQLAAACRDVKPGGTIMIADGHYRMTRYIEITADDVTVRGASGDRNKVVLDGATSRHGELLGITGCAGVTVADLTVQNVKWNGIKINSDRGAQRVTIHNCVLHNVWQRGVKAPAVPKDKVAQLSPRDCRVQYCLFYNDRPKAFADDETDTAKSFNGNYIGGIDVKNTVDWRITDNVFIGIQGRTREGRGCIYISENGRGCVIERNTFIDCDIAIALGNPTLGNAPLQAVDCVARDNLILQCPETGILACYTKDCQIIGNTVHDPQSPRRRLIWVQKSNDGLELANNLIIGAPVLVTSDSTFTQRNNAVHKTLDAALKSPNLNVGQQRLTDAQVRDAVALPKRLRAERDQTAQVVQRVGDQTDACVKAMRKVHAGFDGQAGYVAQFGDSITHSLAFWSPIGWDEPDHYITHDDGLPKKPAKMRWRDYVKGTRDKGPKHANYSGWTARQLLGAVDAVLSRDKPEVAIIMIGTNDISSGRVPNDYRKNLEQIVDKCLKAHCVPMLNTIPPRRGRDAAVNDVNKIVRAVAAERNVPLVDYHAACLSLRPGDTWDGTVISRDGVHPTGGKSNVYTAENLADCGYALRNWCNFMALRQVYFRVLNDVSESHE